ncbi:MAG TPA: hypothetical protein VF666_14015 [Pyrinomonadaceae bacterium]|jgi:hypothetical protein
MLTKFSRITKSACASAAVAAQTSVGYLFLREMPEEMRLMKMLLMKRLMKLPWDEIAGARTSLAPRRF